MGSVHRLSCTSIQCIGNSLSLSQRSNPSCSLVNAIAQSKEIPVPILTQFQFSIFSNVFWNFKRALQGILGHCIPGFLDYYWKICLLGLFRSSWFYNWNNSIWKRLKEPCPRLHKVGFTSIVDSLFIRGAHYFAYNAIILQVNGSYVRCHFALLADYCQAMAKIPYFDNYETFLFC